MTLREMSVEYRAQAQALRGRMQELEKAWKQTKDPAERANLEGRIWTLEVLWRETRDQAVLLERYYEGGTTAMKSIRYRRGRENERDLAVYTRLMAEDKRQASSSSCAEIWPRRRRRGCDGPPEAGPVFIL